MACPSMGAAREERKRPRSQVTSNSHNTNITNYNNIAVYGQESLSHVSDAKLQELLACPDTSIARLITLRHQPAENKNIKVPNVRDRWIQVLKQNENGEKEWETVEKGDILNDLVEEELKH